MGLVCSKNNNHLPPKKLNYKSPKKLNYNNIDNYLPPPKLNYNNKKENIIEINKRNFKNNRICVIFLRVSGILNTIKPFIQSLDSGNCSDFCCTWIDDQKYIFMEKSLDETLNILENTAKRVIIVLLCDSDKQRTMDTISLIKLDKPEKILILPFRMAEDYGYIEPNIQLIFDTPFSLVELNDIDNKVFFQKKFENILKIN